MLGSDLLKGDLVHLDALDRSDVETLGPWWRNLDMTQFVMPLRLVPLTMEDEIEWFEQQRKDKEHVMFAIRRNDTSALIGTVGLLASRSAILRSGARDSGPTRPAWRSATHSSSSI